VPRRSTRDRWTESRIYFVVALNRRFLPRPIKIRDVRLGALAWCFAFFGVFSIIYGIEQFKQLF
jgi:vacuolar-type H+-ATPase subunit I/STV1